ncbi:MAG: L,D-transpeptidase/peptidoglycan binding protein, partial [Eggerthellaceae bacterium]|nr:L,D-transpeptidase/peptidoglycan binding protein [Eggerthellaceae bacterium]
IPAFNNNYTVEYTRERAKRQRSNRRRFRILFIVLACIVAAIAIAYFAGVAAFSAMFFPNTYVGNLNISMKTTSQVQELLEEEVIDNYTISVVGQGLNLELTAADAGVSLEGEDLAEQMHQSVNPWAWPAEIFENHDESDSFVISIGQSTLADTLTTAANALNETATPPTDATLILDTASNSFVISPEVAGKTIDVDKLIATVSESVAQMDSQIVLTHDILQQPSETSDAPTLIAAAETPNAKLATNVDLMAGDYVLTTLDASDIVNWVSLNDDLTVNVDQGAISDWVLNLSYNYDTVGTTRTYTTPAGKTVTVSGGDYGWTISTDDLTSMVSDAVYNSQQGSMDVPFYSTAGIYNGVGAADWGSRYIDVDLTEQHATFYGDDGSVIWESDIVSGNPNSGNATPEGVYYIKSNAGASTLIGYNSDGTESYRTPVSYWMPFEGNSVGFHDASWQSSFGGDRYTYAGSHGCINLPPDAAEEHQD